MDKYKIIRRIDQPIKEEALSVNLLSKSTFLGYEIVSIHLRQGQVMIMPKGQEEYLNALLVVNYGALYDQTIDQTITSGDCLISDHVGAFKSLTALADSDIILIFSMHTLPSNESGDLCFIRSVALAIRKGHAVNPTDLDKIASLIRVQQDGYFRGEPYDQIYEIFSLFFSYLPFAPLKVNPSYASRLCTQWVLTKDDLELALVEALQFVQRLYGCIFMPQVQSKLIRDAIHWTLLDSGETKTVQNLSKALFINRSHLSEKFIDLAGISASDYILSVKMYGAMMMLVNPRVSLSDVLNKLGYNDHGHFTKNFKKVSGMTPQAFKDHYSFLR